MIYTDNTGLAKIRGVTSVLEWSIVKFDCSDCTVTLRYTSLKLDCSNWSANSNLEYTWCGYCKYGRGGLVPISLGN